MDEEALVKDAEHVWEQTKRSFDLFNECEEHWLVHLQANKAFDVDIWSFEYLH